MTGRLWSRLWQLLILALDVATRLLPTLQFCCFNTHTTARVSRNQNGKAILDFSEARDCEWQWHHLGHMQVCTSLQTANHASIPPLSYLWTGCPSCHLIDSTCYCCLKWDTVGWASGRALAGKSWVMMCWCGYLFGARCRLFAYGSADATAIPKPHHLLP